MNKLKKQKKNILCVICLVIVILLILMAVHSVRAFHLVLRENMQAIKTAGIVLNNAQKEDMNQEEYEELMIQYFNMTVNSIQAINGISENLWIFKQYELQEFEDFIFSGVGLYHKDMEQMKVIMEIQESVEKASSALSKLDFSLLTLFVDGKESAIHYFAEIESICEKWEKQYYDQINKI